MLVMKETEKIEKCLDWIGRVEMLGCPSPAVVREV